VNFLTCDGIDFNSNLVDHGLSLRNGIPDRRNLERHVAAWLRDRNIHNVRADWRFTAADARIKLKSLYPAL